LNEVKKGEQKDFLLFSMIKNLTNRKVVRRYELFNGTTSTVFTKGVIQKKFATQITIPGAIDYTRKQLKCSDVSWVKSNPKKSLVFRWRILK